MLINHVVMFLGVEAVDQVIFVLLTTSMWIGGMVGFLLDITLPGTDEERGILKWRETHEHQSDDETKIQLTSIHTYDIPLVTSYLQTIPFVRYIPFLPYYGRTGDVEEGKKESGLVMDNKGAKDSNKIVNGVKETRM